MDDTAEHLGRLGTSTLSDAMDRLGIAGQAFGILPVEPAFRLVGRAFTASYLPVGVDGGTVGDYVEDVPPGDVVVLDNQGRMDGTVWGDILTLAAHKRGVGGTVIDGVCRDTARALELDYPIFSRGHWMRTGKDRVAMVAVNVTVALGGVRVRPQDLLIGDRDGVVVVPRGREAELLDVAARIEAAEEAIRSIVMAGGSLREARERQGYHALQARQANDT